jgi:hypothetical protein
MQKSNAALVITSISPPNPVLRDYASQCRQRGVDFILIGDVPSPADFALDGCEFWGLAQQKKLPFELARVLPERHYARKNLGYLIAMQRNLEVIVETDDDNFALPSFWQERQLRQRCRVAQQTGWLNVYRFFSDASIWPRGFPLEALGQPLPALDAAEVETECPIQQGLANENPDVDAIYRMILPLPQNFDKRGRVALGKHAWCPFNSQNTTWFKPAFPLLYLPSYCSFRMTDIWRSFVALGIAWANGWNVLFHEPTVRQVRNEHNLLSDFADEVPGYLNNDKIVRMIAQLDLPGGVEHIPENLMKCYRGLVARELVGAGELALLDAWLDDIRSLA